MPAKEPTYRGWVAHAASQPLTFTTFEPKPFADTDVEIKVSHCGICGTDTHTLRSAWGPTLFPCVLGHEIVGEVIRVGSSVPSLASPSREIRIGDRVGIGAQSGACLRADCAECADGDENHCTRIVGTYNSKYTDGSKAYGGYATHWRGPAHFVFKIPEALPSAAAAPLLCGGVTTFAPLLHHGAGPGKSVGIIGIGGLGHLGILFAKAMGCDRVVAISRTSGKKTDALEGLGADAFIATDEDKNWAKANVRSLDLIICTVSSAKMPFSQYLRLLKTNGTYIQVGIPEGPMPAFMVYPLVQRNVKIGGSNIGSPDDIRRMLQVAAEKKVLPWVENRPMEEVNQALVDMDAGRARFRYVLVNDAAGQTKL